MVFLSGIINGRLGCRKIAVPRVWPGFSPWWWGLMVGLKALPPHRDLNSASPSGTERPGRNLESPTLDTPPASPVPLELGSHWQAAHSGSGKRCCFPRLGTQRGGQACCPRAVVCEETPGRFFLPAKRACQTPCLLGRRASGPELLAAISGAERRAKAKGRAASPCSSCPSCA